MRQGTDPTALSDLASALFDEAVASHTVGDATGVRMWLRLFWPCVVRIGRQLDQCLRDLVVGDRGCFLAVCVAAALSVRVRATVGR